VPSGSFAPRFLLELGFLAGVAAGAGLADLRPLVIAALMGGCWVLVSLIEWAVWRAQVAVVPAPLPLVYEAEARAAEPAAADEPELEAEGYPLRPDSDFERSEEVEAYTGLLRREEAEAEHAAPPAAAEGSEEGAGGPSEGQAQGGEPTGSAE